MEGLMAEIAGMLLSDLLPDGSVRISFLSDSGTGKELVFTVNNLEAAEAYFVQIVHLTPQLAAAIRQAMERNKVVFLGMSLSEEILTEMLFAHA